MQNIICENYVKSSFVKYSRKNNENEIKTFFQGWKKFLTFTFEKKLQIIDFLKL